jgi:hypothetical protein
MDFGSILGMASALSLAVERAMEVIKICYLKIKKYIFPKKNCTELSQNEKMILTVAASIAGIFIAGDSVILPIPGVVSLPIPLQKVITGLIVSIGSGVLHTLYGMFVALKSNMETVQTDGGTTDNTQMPG